MATQWAHGDTVTAANLNAYSTELTTLHDAIGDAEIVPCMPDQYGSGNIYWFIHRNRWLHFKSTGQIKNAGATQEGTLSPINDTYTSFDLHSLSWLAYCDLYQVVGCAMASEEETPL